MFRFPYFGYPYSYPYYNYPNKYYYNQKKEENTSVVNSNESSKTSSSSDSCEQAIFEIFGIKLYLDDLIILGILFFLYKEEVKDDMLYIILFLLLIS